MDYLGIVKLIVFKFILCRIKANITARGRKLAEFGDVNTIWVLESESKAKRIALNPKFGKLKSPCGYIGLDSA